MAEINIRIMTGEDIGSVAQLEQETFTEPWSENVYRQTVALDGVVYVVAEDGNRIVGACGVRNISGEGEITNVMTRTEYRRQKIAEKMLARLLSEGEKIGIADFTLEVRKSNYPAILLYEKLGFETEGVRPGFYSHPSEDALIMWKRNKD